LLLGLADNPVDPRQQLEIGAVKIILRRQAGDGCGAARRCRCRLEGFKLIGCNLIPRFARGQPSVDLSAFDMLACAAFSCHGSHRTQRYCLQNFDLAAQRSAFASGISR
jgi:hypothetical protein